jgi:hypothetical protein
MCFYVAFIILIIAIVIGYLINDASDSIDWKTTVLFDGESVHLKRVAGGNVMEIDASTFSGSLFGLGYAHVRYLYTHVTSMSYSPLCWQAKDRAVQMFFVRTIVQGRLSELIANNNKTNTIDTILKTSGYYRDSELAAVEMKKSHPKAFNELLAYCKGVNYFMKTEKRTLEMILVK